MRLHESFDEAAHPHDSIPERMQFFWQVRDEIGKHLQEWLRTADQLSDPGQTSSLHRL